MEPEPRTCHVKKDIREGYGCVIIKKTSSSLCCLGKDESLGLIGKFWKERDGMYYILHVRFSPEARKKIKDLNPSSQVVLIKTRRQQRPD